MFTGFYNKLNSFYPFFFFYEFRVKFTITFLLSLHFELVHKLLVYVNF